MQTLSAPPAFPQPAQTKSSAVKAGWICLAIGACTFWIFGLGFLFFSVAMVLAVVAMCTNRVSQGIALLLSSLGALVVCVLIFFLAIVGTIGVAAQKASEDIKRGQQTHRFSAPRVP